MVWIVEVSKDGGVTWLPKTPWNIGLNHEPSAKMAERLNERHRALPSGHKFAGHQFRSAAYVNVETVEAAHG
jgi:hypothetical protein